MKITISDIHSREKYDKIISFLDQCHQLFVNNIILYTKNKSLVVKSPHRILLILCN
jgi:hypothetical protein